MNTSLSLTTARHRLQTSEAPTVCRQRNPQDNASLQQLHLLSTLPQPPGTDVASTDTPPPTASNVSPVYAQSLLSSGHMSPSILEPVRSPPHVVDRTSHRPLTGHGRATTRGTTAYRPRRALAHATSTSAMSARGVKGRGSRAQWLDKYDIGGAQSDRLVRPRVLP